MVSHLGAMENPYIPTTIYERQPKENVGPVFGIPIGEI
jgi:hypothetical protein